MFVTEVRSNWNDAIRREDRHTERRSRRCGPAGSVNRYYNIAGRPWTAISPPVTAAPNSKTDPGNAVGQAPTRPSTLSIFGNEGTDWAGPPAIPNDPFHRDQPGCDGATTDAAHAAVKWNANEVPSSLALMAKHGPRPRPLPGSLYLRAGRVVHDEVRRGAWPPLPPRHRGQD